MWATDRTNGTLVRIDPATNEIAATYELGTSADGFRIADDAIWVAADRSGEVFRVDPEDGSVAAHYLRPVARDMHGHVQKLGPAVLATWDGRAGRFEHFGWGVTPELAMRTGRHAGDFEIELERRREALERGVA